MQDIAFQNNTVFGEPAGKVAVAVSPIGSEGLTSPRMEVWPWPRWQPPAGPAMLTGLDTVKAKEAIIVRLRPEIHAIRDVRTINLVE